MKRKLIFLMAMLCLVVGRAGAQSTITWKIVAPEDGKQYYVYSLNQKKYLNDNNGWDETATTLWTFSGNTSKFSLKSQNNKYFATYYSVSLKLITTYVISNGGTSGGFNQNRYSIEFATAGDKDGYSFFRSEKWNIAAVDRNLKSTSSFLEFCNDAEYEFVFVSKEQYDAVVDAKGEAVMKVQANTYGTFCAPFDVAIPNGIKAYNVKGLESNNSTLTLNEISNTIPANKPVLLENTTSTLYQDTKKGDVQGTTEGIVNGLLTGVYKNTTATAGSYVLQNSTKGVAFYKVNAGNEPTVGANRAYLKKPSTSDVSYFTFRFEEETAIETVSALTSNDIQAIYSSNGAKINSLQKGMNIIKMSDGSTKKIIVE